MSGLGECVYRDGLEVGIQAMILDNLEEKTPMEKILAKLQKRFNLTEEKAEEYYRKFVQEETPA